ncbi:MAG: PIN domain-containing protein [Chloroflexi bacterium]|nr:PIN domain-containing protein [Chloroflexota bacterium]MBL7163403.1 PIN domain-containing protein [Anaerolineales bacterium]
MTPTKQPKPQVFIDADVLFAGAASPTEHGASLLILRLAEITLIDTLTSEQVITEAQRNLNAKLPHTLPAFNHLVSRCLKVLPNPNPEELLTHQGIANPKDLPILVAALREGCPWLVTFNIRHFQPGHPDVGVLRPGEFVLKVRDQLARLNAGE